MSGRARDSPIKQPYFKTNLIVIISCSLWSAAALAGALSFSTTNFVMWWRTALLHNLKLSPSLSLCPAPVVSRSRPLHHLCSSTTHRLLLPINWNQNNCKKIGCAQSIYTAVNLQSKMAPVISPGQDISSAVSEWIEKNDVMVFSKTTCPFCIKLKKIFKEKRIEFVSVELNTMGEDGVKIQEELLKTSGQKTVPNVFVRGKHIGEKKI